jgi:hypothetical protein
MKIDSEEILVYDGHWGGLFYDVIGLVDGVFIMSQRVGMHVDDSGDGYEDFWLEAREWVVYRGMSSYGSKQKQLEKRVST